MIDLNYLLFTLRKKMFYKSNIKMFLGQNMTFTPASLLCVKTHEQTCSFSPVQTYQNPRSVMQCFKNLPLLDLPLLMCVCLCCCAGAGIMGLPVRGGHGAAPRAGLQGYAAAAELLGAVGHLA